MFPKAADWAKGVEAPLFTLPLMRNPSAALPESSGVTLSTLLPLEPLAAALGLAPLVVEPGEALTSARWKAVAVLATAGGVFFKSFLDGGLAGVAAAVVAGGAVAGADDVVVVVGAGSGGAGAAALMAS